MILSARAWRRGLFESQPRLPGFFKEERMEQISREEAAKFAYELLEKNYGIYVRSCSMGELFDILNLLHFALRERT